MTLIDLLSRDEPMRKSRIRNRTKRLNELYKIVNDNFDEIDRGVFGGYSWYQIEQALQKVYEPAGKWSDKWSSTDISAMYNFICKEREIKGIA